MRRSVEGERFKVKKNLVCDFFAFKLILICVNPWLNSYDLESLPFSPYFSNVSYYLSIHKEFFPKNSSISLIKDSEKSTPIDFDLTVILSLLSS